jgi:CBS domain-containing protein
MSTTHFKSLVSQYMTAPVRAIAPTAPLAQAYAVLREHAFSSLAVTDERGALVGLISRTDLLHAGRIQLSSRRGKPLIELPHKAVGDVMHREVVIVGPDASVHDAARALVQKHIHRVFVQDGGRLVGVFSTRDMMRAIFEHRVTRPVSDLMSSPVLTVRTNDTVATATEQLNEARVTGLVVLDDDERPVGIFTQVEALQCKDVPPATPVEEQMNYAVLCLPLKTPLYRAAGQAAEMNVRRVIVTEGQKIWGILTGIDFARAAV